jgi:GLPGLI family protein
MLKKIISIICLLGYVYISNAQTITLKGSVKDIYGEVTYQIKMSSKKTENYKNSTQRKKMNIENRKIIDKMFFSSSVITSKLKFNKQESIYFLESRMKNDFEKGINFVKLQAGNNSIFYSTTIKNIEQNCDLLGECFLITNSKNIWELSQETKKIGKYITYKAVSTRTYKGKKSYTTAWYTNQIPIQFGPKTYNGLPGLIIELENNDLIYRAVKINLNSSSNQIKIEKPTEGKEVTRKEFKKIFWKGTPSFKK